MAEGDSYWHGRHFWTHFWIGLIIGGAAGAWFSIRVFESVWAVLGVSALTALVVGYCGGKWGDPFWYGLLEWWGS